MYTFTNFKTKKALKEAVKAGLTVTVYDNSIMATGEPINGVVSIEGPHYPQPHTFYASAVVKDSVIVKVS